MQTYHFPTDITVLPVSYYKHNIKMPVHLSAPERFHRLHKLYHVCQLSQKCPNFPPGISGSPVNTSVSVEKEYPTAADKQYSYHLFITSHIPLYLLRPSVYAGFRKLAFYVISYTFTYLLHRVSQISSLFSGR